MTRPNYNPAEDLDLPATRRDLDVLIKTIGADQRELEHRRAELPGIIRQAVAQGMRDAMADEQMTAKFWEAGYRRLSQHTTDGLSQWVGKRVIMILVAAAFSGSIAWAVLTGRIK